MAGEVRFAEQIHSGQAAGSRKLMPERLTDNLQPEFQNDPTTNVSQPLGIAQRVRGTSPLVDEPFRPAHGGSVSVAPSKILQLR